jgi:translation elongation factor EF-Ts
MLAKIVDGKRCKDVSAAALDAARADLASATEAQMPGKPAEVLAKLVDGKVAKWFKDVSGIKCCVARRVSFFGLISTGVGVSCLLSCW